MVNKKIKLYLENNGISQSYLARRLGVNTSSLSYTLNYGKKMDIEMYCEVCKILKTPLDTFLSYTLINEKKPQSVAEDYRCV